MIAKLLSSLIRKREERRYKGPLGNFIVERTETSESSEFLGRFSHRKFGLVSIKSLLDIPVNKHSSLLHLNDLVVNLSSGLSFGLIKDLPDGICTTFHYNHVFRVRDLKKLNPLFLKLIFESQKFQEEVSYKCQKGEKEKKKLEDFLDIEITFPSLKKQKQVIKEYQLLRETIDKKKDANKELSNLFNSYRSLPVEEIVYLYKINRKIIKILSNIQENYINQLN